jgi:predicted CXXCH cytochrome family protein
MSGAPTLGGTNLSKTHPINFPVRTDDFQTDLNTGGNTAHMGPGVTSGYDWTTKPVLFPLFKTTDANAARSTTNRSLECGSCHAVHDSTNSPFLRDTIAGSKLCLGCHNK